MLGLLCSGTELGGNVGTIKRGHTRRRGHGLGLAKVITGRLLLLLLLALSLSDKLSLVLLCLLCLMEGLKSRSDEIVTQRNGYIPDTSTFPSASFELASRIGLH